MSNKIFTAQEMREAADTFWVGGVICEVKDEDGRVVKHIKHDAIIAMLRQAADALEREERHAKNYEYGIRYCVDDGSVFEDERHFDSLEDAKDNADVSGYDELKFARRSVGEWEVVRDGEKR